ncbi:hypothetical protein Tco_1416151 [Tanacetum coccineum]
MASKQFSLGPEPHLMTLGTISSSAVPNPPSLTPVVSPVPAVVAPEPADLTGTPSSTIIDQDAPSANNDPFFGVPIPEPNSEESSSRDVIPTNVHSVNQPLEQLRKWTKDHPLDYSLEILLDLSLQDINYKTKPCFATLMLSSLPLKHALRVWYDLLSSFLLSEKFSKSVVDLTLFTQKEGKYILPYGMESCDPVDTPMVEKSKLDADP